ncbi:DUF2325 domain-containing protein [Clostridium sp. MSJ-11]|uniref:DUF2325 domain-containing protein n=1 Tax=Clostridium mobile TaxID=2841512 RepID=A0ABS6EHG1_9CLOT|nr:DUF2325 domain-containing protein [Clostridium mobile]MBU5484664.1 DUF2325 domain-containing protein [Clostridium mobile]
MSVLLVGGDRLGNIKENLRKNGFDKIEHVTGRRNVHTKIKIPCDTDLVVVLTDFINHKVTETIKMECKKRNTKIVYSKRSWVYMECIIKNCIEKGVQ